jgi:excisionase family DNA binding protein
MLSLPKSIRPRGMSDIKVERLKALVWDDPDFWQAVIAHGINLITVDEMKVHDPGLYEDFIGNFFQVLYQIAAESKPTKPQASANADAVHIPDGWYLSLEQIAERFGVKPRTVQQWLDNGSLPSITLPNLGRVVNAEDVYGFVPPKLGETLPAQTQ